MVGRVYNIAKLTSSPSKIYFEGDVLLSGDCLSLRSPDLRTELFKNVQERKDVVIDLTPDACLRLLRTNVHPAYRYSDFICYSIFEVQKIRIRDYKEVVDDIRHLKFLSLRRGITNVLGLLAAQFDQVVTDLPDMFNPKAVDIVDISEVNLGFSNNPLAKVVDREVLINYNIPGEIRQQTRLPFSTSLKTLVLLFDNQLVANDLAKFFPFSIPVTLFRYPGAL